MIKTYPDEFLTRVLPKCKKPVKQDIVDLMMDVVSETACLGLAANQVGIPYRVIVVLKRFMVNPVILEYGDEVIRLQECCLSLPEQVFEVQRHAQVLVQWQTPDFQETIIQRWKGTSSLVTQHEIDHLNGILINDSQ